MKDAVFWDITPCGFVFFRSVHRLLLTANIVPRLTILVTLMMEAIRSSEKTVLSMVTRRNVPEDRIHLRHVCGCETWSLILREKLRLGVFEDGAEGNTWAEEK
jgi:hypothetical protein